MTLTRVCLMLVLALTGCQTPRPAAKNHPRPSQVSMTQLFERAQTGLNRPLNASKGLKVVELWAGYCGACEAAAPKFEALYKRYGQCAQFMALYVDENPKRPLRLAKRLGVTYPIGPDPDYLFSRALFLEQLPTIYVFDEQNELIFTQSGLSDGLSYKLAELITDQALDPANPNAETCVRSASTP